MGFAAAEPSRGTPGLLLTLLCISEEDAVA